MDLKKEAQQNEGIWRRMFIEEDKEEKDTEGEC
jgi:hypothetical protein